MKEEVPGMISRFKEAAKVMEI